MDPGMGEAYWSLADLKNYVFSEAEIASMQSLLKGDDGDDEDQAHLHFALGQGLRAQAGLPHRVRSLRDAAIAGGARPSPFDIEVVREQDAPRARMLRCCIFRLAGRAPDIPTPPRYSSSACRDPARRWWSRYSPVTPASRAPSSSRTSSPSCASSTTPTRRTMPIRKSCAPPRRSISAHLGRRYIEETAPLRGARPYFIDKMPNNFSHVGLIQAILPRAVIIDARRHPMDACFSTYKQHFAEGQSFSYDLEDLGRYYRCYLSLMDHWDAVLPGKVLHLQYEQLIRDPEAQIRRLLSHCSLAFRARVPVVPRDPAAGAHRERRAGAPAPVHVRASATGAISRRSSNRCGARWANRWSDSPRSG